MNQLLTGEKEFEKPLIDLVYTTICLDDFIIKQYYVTDRNDLPIQQKIYEIVDNWLKENTTVVMSKSIIQYFCHQVIPFLNNKKIQRVSIIIIAKEEDTYTLFRNSIQKIISDDYFLLVIKFIIQWMQYQNFF